MEWQQGFVLHRRPYRETSALVDIFSASQGRFSCVARGRGRKGGNVALLQPFTLLNLSVSGKTDLKNLRQVETVVPAVPLPGERLYLGLYLNELLHKLLPQGLAVPELFTCYQQTLIGLGRGESVEQQLRGFELALLDSLGFTDDFSQDSQGQDIDPQQQYFYQDQVGFVRLTDVYETGPVCFSGEVLIALSQRNFQQAHVLSQAKVYTRQKLAALLGNKPLQSRALFIKRNKQHE